MSTATVLRKLVLLWRIRVKQLLTSVSGSEGFLQFSSLLLLVIFLAFMASLSYLFNQLFVEFLTIPILGRYVMLQTLSLVFLSFFLLLLFSSMVTSLSTQFMSNDLDFLFGTHLSGRLLYWMKAGEAIFHSSWMVVVFAFPILISYGQSVGSPWFYYPASLFVLIPFVVIPYSLGSFLVNAVLYFIPIKRVRAVLVGIGIIFGIIMVYILRLLSPELLFKPELARNLFVDFLGTLEVGKVTGLPSYHASYFLHNLSAENYSQALYHYGWLTGLAVLSVVILGGIAQFWYSPSWLRTREGRPNQSRIVDLTGWGVWDLLPPTYAALLKKEVLRFTRQTAQWSQLLVLGGILIVHITNLIDIPSTSAFLNHVLFFVNIGLIGFVMTAICVRFVFPTISFEGEYFWIVRSAPISMNQFYFQKTLFYVVPVGLLGAGLAMVSNGVLSVGFTLWIWSVVLVGSLSFVLTAGALAAGTYFPKFNFDHFSEVVTSAGSMIYMIFGMFYVAGVVGITLIPIYRQLGKQMAPRARILQTFPPMVIIVSLISVLLGLVLLWAGARKVEDYGFGRL